MNNSQPTTSLLDQGEPISIAQLSPDVPGQDARVIIGTVTITWPFSILNKSIAFLLAERDFRLRRENGQVRIRFHGAAAKAIADASLGAGDEVRVSLQGVKWEKNETQTQVAGSTLAWQLEFTNRLVLGIRRPGEERDTLLTIDAPDAETGTTTTNGQIDKTDQIDTLTSAPEEAATPTPSSPEVTLPVKRTASSTLGPLEFASPAFLKRARVSYGALFEGDIEMFDDDDDVGRTKSKKRTRFSLPANSWRYTSRSPSPEPENDREEEDKEESYMRSVSQRNGDTEDTTTNTTPRPRMVDQGSQTVYVDFTPMASVQVLAESRPAFGLTQTTPTPFARTRLFERDDSLVNQSLQLAGDSTTPQGMPPRTDEYLLGHTPSNVNTDMPFSFTPQTVLFPQAPGYFSEENAQDIVTDSPGLLPRAMNYPAEFLETENPPQNVVEALAGLASHEPQSSGLPQIPLGAEPAFHPAFTATSQPPQTAWAIGLSPGPRSAAASSDAENPVEILSSSPFREQGSRGSSNDRQLSPSRENTDMNTTANVSPEPALEEPASEAEYYRDGGDEPGDDYDLRKYSRTHDDDDDMETSEEEPDPNTNDPDIQIMNPDEDDADGDEDVVNQEEYLDDEYPDTYEQRSDVEGEEYEGSEGDAEGEYDSDEYYYDDEDGREEDVDTRPSAPLASREPVIIDLLSDSEDEEAPEPEPEAAMDAEVENKDDKPVLGIEEAKTSPASKIEGDFQVPEADKIMAEEENQHLSRFDTDEEPLSSTKEGKEQATEAGIVDSNQMGPMNEGQVPTSDSEGSIKHEAEVAEAAICATRIGDDNEITDKAKSPVTSSAPREFPSAEVLQCHDYEAGKKSNPVEAEAEACDIDMRNAPPLLGEAKGHEAKDITPGQSAETNPLDETAVEPEATVEAMDIDEPPHRPTPTMEILEANVGISGQVYTATTEAPYEALTDSQEPSPQPQETIHDDARSSNVPKTGTLSGESQAMTFENQENIESQISQGPEHSESHENMSDRLSEVATKPASQMVNALDQADNGEVEKASDEAQPENGGQISPPPTQDPEVQTLLEDSIKVSHDRAVEHLPTPGGTQQVIEVETVGTLSVITHANQMTEEEEEEGPEDQIMAEILQQSPVQPETRLSTDPALSTVTSQTKSPHHTGPADRPLIGSPQDAEAASEIIVAKSLRPRRHKPTKSSDGNGHDDPSLAFITTTPTLKTTDRGSKPSSPAASSSKTRSKTHRDDPSIQLAGGSVQADTKNKGKRKVTDDESIHSVDNNSPGSQRVLRPRNDHGDPSILLAKGSSPSTRQTRSQKTPDPKRETPRRETRSVSRSFHRQEESPNLSFASLKSPSIAGSTATVLCV
ncbi:uncharacterized protein BKA55DRAFT_553586 [Fusarium redolens]|uniref:Telomeric single stranded DNA binding POT1/Cdc13 domain-containing protein n=1 Tax=Fusarium redolens TaxID=48865 RepID=A0A9P9KQY5_FUSRE|nr:uncharacterized protein BKA55DRAFT_553586 [Fusarium redolens]KAH7266882.1 hypothetical protein BKA55DRAFT_553586 [Fusarium redolens]